MKAKKITEVSTWFYRSSETVREKLLKSARSEFPSVPQRILIRFTNINMNEYSPF
jgi:hypothetical protein